jgi:hypothetical protein
MILPERASQENAKSDGKIMLHSPPRASSFLVRSVMLLALLSACNSSKGNSSREQETPPPPAPKPAIKFEGSLSTPVEARVDLRGETLSKFKRSHELLFRYLAGNPRWEIREERGLRYAIRKEEKDGAYKTSLNGFYSSFESDVMLQTRVLLSFDKPFGFGRDYGNITRFGFGSDFANVIVEGEHNGSPGNSSYLIVDGAGLFLEIFDQAPEIERKFSQKTVAEVSAELSAVLEHQEEIEKRGIMAQPSHYPVPPPQEASFVVADGSQLGIYYVEGAVQSTAPGVATIRVFRTKDGQRLSESRITDASTRHMGWSKGGKEFFRYSSEVTVYVGDWETKYEARFELWHKAREGTEKKLAEATRMINGWQR